MKYEILTEQTFSGITHSVKFPVEQMDRKALYTIQNDWPDFLVPFTYMNVDNQIECVYQLGNRSKLKYRFGERDSEAYISLWENILRPLMNCDDWFTKPFSFVLDTDYLYIDQAGRISYLYIPSLDDCSEYQDLISMATDLSQKNHVTDAQLEVKVLQSIMQGFQPKAFLNMLQKYRGETGQKNSAGTPVQNVNSSVSNRGDASAFERSTPKPRPISQSAFEAGPAPEQRPADLPADGTDDIVIRFENDKGSKKKTAEAQKKKEGETGRFKLFGGKKKKEVFKDELILGAASEQKNQPIQYSPAEVVVTSAAEENEVTQLSDMELKQTRLRLVGSASLPNIIPVNLENGQCFTIGRFDISVGYKQSDFEFDKSTRAVSRHHAVIERADDGSYQIIDMASKAGTFVNGVKLTPNAPHKLESGARVSFGTSGVDYVWEE